MADGYLPSVLRFPSPRLEAGGVIEVDDHLPDLVLGEPILPCGHHRVPGCGLLWKAGTPFGNPPEEERFGEHGDGAGVREVGRRRVEDVSEVTGAVKIVAVTVHTVLDVDLSALLHILFKVCRVLSQR